MTEIKFTVLIVEDEENIGNFISTILKTNGYKPIIATTGTQAIQCAESYCPDIILLDLGLPDMDGIDVISEIRKWAVTPIIVISARNSESEKVKALDAGADDYITKPFGNQELLARIRTALRHRRQPMETETKTPMYHADQLKIDFDKRRVFPLERKKSGLHRLNISWYLFLQRMQERLLHMNLSSRIYGDLMQIQIIGFFV